jgi:hypothetical protein
MIKLIFLGFLVFSFSQFARAEVIKYETAKNLSKFMKQTIDTKDAPATCWFLGQVHGYALALKNAGDAKGSKVFELAKAGAGKCGGVNSANASETFTPEEWLRLSDLQKKIENLSL